MDLPDWFYATDGSLPQTAIVFYDEVEGISIEEEYLNLIEEYNQSKGVQREDQITIHRLSGFFQILLLYEDQELNQELIRYTAKDPNIVLEYDLGEQNLDNLIHLLDVVRKNSEVFSSIDHLIAAIHQHPIESFDSIFIHLLEEVVRRSTSEIKFFYHSPPNKIEQMCKKYEALVQTLDQTLQVSELLSKHYLGKISGPVGYNIPDYITDHDFLRAYLDDQHNPAHQRYSVLLSLIYRQTLPNRKMIELLKIYFEPITSQLEDHRSRSIKLFTFLLRSELENSIPEFLEMYLDLSRYDILDASKIAELLLKGGKAADFTTYCDTHDVSHQLFDPILSILETIIDPSEEDDDNSSSQSTHWE